MLKKAELSVYYSVYTDTLAYKAMALGSGKAWQVLVSNSLGYISAAEGELQIHQPAEPKELSPPTKQEG